MLVVFVEHLERQIYWDGVKIEGTGSGMSYSNADGAIGHRRTNVVTPPDRYFHGIIDNMRVYDQALTEGDIEILYHEEGWDKN